MTKERELDEKPIAYWDTQNGTLIPAVPLSSERTCFEVPLVPLYLHPRADIFDEVVKALKYVMTAHGEQLSDAFEKAQNALAKLEEKNK